MTDTASTTSASPYVGPRPFRLGERNFFGREREILDLRDLLVARRVVLLYSPSGAGKTSLIQAGLIPSLQAEGYRCLPVIRVGHELEAVTPAEGEPAPNRYRLSLLASLEEALPVGQRLLPSDLAGFSMADYLAAFLEKTTNKQIDDELGQLLILDQFEEILTQDPTDIAAKDEFFQELGAVLRNSPFLALFAMREDYVASLDPYLRSLPERLNVRFRIDLLGEKAALAAIQGPTRQLDPPVEFADDAAQELVNDLRQTRLQLPDGSIREAPGPQVEPVQLQVVCQRLWQNRRDPTRIGMDDLRQLRSADEQMLADLSDTAVNRPLTNVDLALGGYYAERLAEIATAQATPERTIRNWFENTLITPQGLRGMVMEQPGQSSGLDNRLIKALGNAYLVRSEKRRGLNWYELAHDRLIDPVRQNNAWWFKNRLALLQRQADLWEREGRPDHLLLRGPTLAEQETWIADHRPELNDLDRAFLIDSQKVRDDEQRELLAAQERARVAAEKAELQRRANQRLRIFMIVVAVLSVAAILAGVAAYTFSNTAARNLRLANQANAAAVAEQTKAADAVATAAYAVGTAQSAQQQSLLQQSTSDARATQVVDQQWLTYARSTEVARSNQVAATANEQASRNLQNALQAQSTAQAAQAAALEMQARAEQSAGQARQAFSSQLAIAALSALEDKSDLAPLLAVEAYCSADTGDARRALLTLLQADMQNQIALLPPAIDARSPVHAVAYSPTGRWIAWGVDEGPVTWRDVETGETYQDPPDLRLGSVRTLSFSPDERWLVSGGFDSYIVLRDLQTGETRKTAKFPRLVHSLDIDPTNRLAASLSDEVRLWPLAELWAAAESPPENIVIEGIGDIFNLAWDPAGRRLATAGKDASVRVTDLESGAVVFMEKKHTKPVRAVAWSPDGARLASVGDDGLVVIWDPQTGKVIGEPMVEKNRRPLYDVSFNSDGRLLATGGVNDELVVWDIATRQPVARLEDEFINNISGLAFSPLKAGGKDRLLAGSISGQVGLFSVAVEQTLTDALPDVPEGYLIALWADTKGGYLGLSQASSGTQAYETATGAESWQPVSPLFEPVTAAAFTTDGATLAIAPQPQPGQTHASLLATDGWSETGRLEFPLAGEQSSPLFGLAFDLFANTLAASQCVLERVGGTVCTPNQNHLIFQRTGNNGGEIQNVNVGENTPRSLAFDPLGRYLATGGEAPGVQIWQLSSGGQSLTGDQPAREIVSERPATALAFSPDGRILAVALDDWTIELWEVDRWQRLGFPQSGSNALITSLAFDPAGAWLIAATQDGAVQRWLVDPYIWAQKTCALATRPMTDKEWGLYFGSAPFNPACRRLVECKGR